MCDEFRSIQSAMKRPFVSEMGPIPGAKAYRSSMADVIKDADTLFQPMMDDVLRMVRNAYGADDKIPILNKVDLQQRVGERIMALFVVPGSRRSFDPVSFVAETPFMELLNRFYVRVTFEAIEQSRAWMGRNLPEDVFRWLSNQNLPPVLEADNPFLRRDEESVDAFLARMDDLRVFRPNPLAEYERMHTWVDPNGYTLSRRIWSSATEAREKIDRVLEAAINEGMGSLDLSRLLEDMLLPSRTNIRTMKPYDTNASFDAMRLARTEIARAANQAAFIAAYTNPYVNQIDVARSLRGDVRCPICPQHATIGIGGGRLREPYSIHAANVPPFHPNCMCHVRSVLVDSPATVTLRLRAVVEEANRTLLPPAVTPAMRDALLQRMLGRAMFNLIAQNIQPLLL